MTNFEDINDYFMAEHGFALFLIEEPYLMMRKRKVARWVGSTDPNITVLKRNGRVTTRYPRSPGIIMQGGQIPISFGTLISNLKDERPLYSKV